MVATNQTEQQGSGPDQPSEQGLIDRWIEENPQHPGRADARLRQRGVPVWALIGHALAVNGDSARVACDYDLPREAAEAAFAYYRRYKPFIDDRLAANAS